VVSHFTSFKVIMPLDEGIMPLVERADWVWIELERD
jgi:hypothetical protein